MEHAEILDKVKKMDKKKEINKIKKEQIRKRK